MHPHHHRVRGDGRRTGGHPSTESLVDTKLSAMRSGIQNQRDSQQENRWWTPSCPQCGAEAKASAVGSNRMVGPHPVVRNADSHSGCSPGIRRWLVLTHSCAMWNARRSKPGRYRAATSPQPRTAWCSPTCPQCGEAFRTIVGTVRSLVLIKLSAMAESLVCTHLSAPWSAVRPSNRRAVPPRRCNPNSWPAPSCLQGGDPFRGVTGMPQSVVFTTLSATAADSCHQSDAQYSW